MDFLRSQLNRIQQQVGGLSASQKMLAAALVVIMLMTVFWWARFAGTAEMVPLLNQSMSQDDIGRMSTFLRAHGMAYQVSGDRIVVSAEKQQEALAMLAFEQMLPQETVIGFDEMAAKMSPWDTQAKTKAFLNEAKQSQLAAMIRRWQGVQDVIVRIDPTDERRIGVPSSLTAVVSITTRTPEAATQKLADAAAMAVAGAQANLRAENVKVVINGNPRRVRRDDPDSGMAGTVLEQVQAWSKHFEENIRRYLEYGGSDVRVMVTVNVDAARRSRTTETMTPGKGGKIAIEEKTSNSESNSGGGNGGEPGGQPNTQMAINTGSTPGASDKSTTEESTSKFLPLVNRESERAELPAGKGELMSVAVSVPRSFIVQAFKLMNPAVSEPTAEQIEAFRTIQLAQIRQSVVKGMNLKEESVMVDTYFDMATLGPPATAASAAGGLGFMLPVSGYVREIALGALALLSLFMISMIVKKGQPPVSAAVVAAAKKDGEQPAPQLGEVEAIAGMAGEGNALLDGMELTEEQIKSQQMSEQVASMVKDNPDAAAALVKRWLNRT